MHHASLSSRNTPNTSSQFGDLFLAAKLPIPPSTPAHVRTGVALCCCLLFQHSHVGSGGIFTRHSRLSKVMSSDSANLYQSATIMNQFNFEMLEFSQV